MEILKEEVNSLCLEEQVTTMEIEKEKFNSLCQELGISAEQFTPIEGSGIFRKACDADFDELKLFISEVFGHIDDGVHLNCVNTVTKYIVRNRWTRVFLMLKEDKDHKLKEPSPIFLYAALSYIDLKADLCCSLKNYILNLTQKYASDDFKSKVALLNAKNVLKLIFSDRKEFCSPEFCKLLHDSLRRSSKGFVNNGDHFFYVAKIFKVKQISSTNTKGEELIVWMNSEDTKFADQASDYFEYPVNPKIVSGLPDRFWTFGPDKWNPDDYETAVPWRRVFLIKFDTLNTILKNLEEVF